MEPNAPDMSNPPMVPTENKNKPTVYDSPSKPIDTTVIIAATAGASKSVSNMGEFFQTDFGNSIKKDLVKTKNQFQDQSVYEVSQKVNSEYLKKGDKLYLDNLHKDHLEVFDKKGNAKAVLNLDGTLNLEKTEKVLKEKRKIRFK